MSNRRRVPAPVVSCVVILALTLTIQSAAANTCAKCRKYCEKMKKKTKMTDLVVCGNDGKTYEDNCEFIHQQCLALAKGKLLMITDEGPCITVDAIDNTDNITQVDGVDGKLDNVGDVDQTGNIDNITATVETIGEINDVDLHVTDPTLDAIGKLDDVDAVDDTLALDAVPTIPNKRPPIPSPKAPRAPATINPRIGLDEDVKGAIQARRRRGRQ